MQDENKDIENAKVHAAPKVSKTSNVSNVLKKLSIPNINTNHLYLGLLGFVVCFLIFTIIIKNGTYRQDMAGYPQGRMAQRNSIACPGCGQTGAPVCPRCETFMHWQHGQGLYGCQRCQRLGIPFCPVCKRPNAVGIQGAITSLPQNQNFVLQQMMHRNSRFVQNQMAMQNPSFVQPQANTLTPRFTPRQQLVSPPSQNGGALVA